MAELIKLRPHHVQRFFYDWQGEDIAAMLASEDEVKYSESHVENIKANYRLLFEENNPFVVVSGIDDICLKCNVLEEKRPNCTMDDDLFKFAGFGHMFGIDFDAEFASEKPKVYLPVNVIETGIASLKKAVEEEKAYEARFRRDIIIGELETSISSLQASYEMLCLKFKQTGGK